MLTPFLPDGAIDAAGLGAFIQKAYGEAGFARQDIDSGAVILTGEAIKKKNAQAIDELFAAEAGKFVCATAGHKLECTLAAHGAGAVRLSQERGEVLLHVDIGGGTIKLALIDKGTNVGVAALPVGGPLLAAHHHRPRSRRDPAVRERIARRIAGIAADYNLGTPRDKLGRALALTEDLPRKIAPAAITFSGGVSEYVFGYEEHEYGDIAKLLAAALTDELKRRTKLLLIDPGQRIRATVIGASQFTVQVSGKTIYLSDPKVLPVHNVPVFHAGLDLSGAFEPRSLTASIEASLARMDLAP